MRFKHKSWAWKVDQQEAEVFNRPIRCTDAGWAVEADPLHSEFVLKQLGIEDRVVSIPGVSGIDEEDTGEDVKVEGKNITRYRGVTDRCNYLAADRPDCVVAIKEGCREISKLTTGSLRRLRCIGRYINMRPSIVWKYAMQGEIDTITFCIDAD